MPTANLEILIRARDEATAKLKEMNAAIEDANKQLKLAGAAAVGAGAAIFGALAYAAKGAADEQAGIERLRGAMANVGLSYDDARVSLEAWIAAQMKSTAFADDQQREALAQLVSATHDLTQAQSLLTTAMDFARARGVDLATSTDLITKVYSGNVGMLSRYGIVVRDGATATEALAEVQQITAGQAQRFGQTVSGQMQILKNNFDELREAIGGQLLPVIQSVIRPVSEFVRQLAATDPAMLNAVTNAGLVTAAIGVLGGGLLLTTSYIPRLVTALNTVKLAAIGLNTVLGFGGWLGIAALAVGATGLLVGKYAELQSQTRAAQQAQDGLNRSFDATTARIQFALGNLAVYGYATDAAKERMKAWQSSMNQMNDALEKNRQELDSSKVALATAQYVIDGTTYRMSLFTEAEIRAHEAAGEKITRLQLQNDTMSTAGDVALYTSDAMRDFTQSEGQAAAQAVQTNVTVEQLLAQLQHTEFGASAMFGYMINSIHNSGVDTMTLIRNYLSEWSATIGSQTDTAKQGLAELLVQIQSLPPEKQINIIMNYISRGQPATGTQTTTTGTPPTTTGTPSPPAPTGGTINGEPISGWGYSPYPQYQHGGMVRETGLALVHAGETVLPAQTRAQPIVIENIIKLDGRELGRQINRFLADEARLKGY